MSLANPLNLLLLPPIAYLVYLIVFPTPSRPKVLPQAYAPEHYNWLPARHPEVTCYKNYTAKEMEAYGGRNKDEKDGGRILLAIMNCGRDTEGKTIWGTRSVFDVSAGRGFYGPDGMYGNFAGRDASRGMAKQSFDEDMLTPTDKPLDGLLDLTPAELDNMRGWHEHFLRKYTIVGELIEG